MMDNGQSGDQPRPARTMAIRLAAGLAAGLPVGWLVGKFFKMHNIHDLPWSDDGALAIAMTFLVCGFGVIGLTATQRGRAILANPGAPEFDRPIAPDQVGFFRLQAGVLILAGIMLALPVLVAVLGQGAAPAHGAALMAAVLIGFAMQTALNLMIWRRADEVVRQVIAMSGAASFWLLQGAFFLWACGVKLHVLPEISSWDAVTVLMGVYLIMSTIVAYRRGLG
jgi:hypothetical protein